MTGFGAERSFMASIVSPFAGVAGRRCAPCESKARGVPPAPSGERVPVPTWSKYFSSGAPPPNSAMRIADWAWLSKCKHRHCSDNPRQQGMIDPGALSDSGGHDRMFEQHERWLEELIEYT